MRIPIKFFKISRIFLQNIYNLIIEKFIIQRLYIIMCTCLYSACVYICSCAVYRHVCRGQKLTYTIFLSCSSTLIFSLNWKLIDMARLAGQWATRHYLPSFRVTDTCFHTWSFIWVPGTQTEVLTLTWQAFCYQSHVPSPSFALLNLWLFY